MLHPSTKKLIDRLCEMTLQRKIDWTNGDQDDTLAYDTEGYRVLLEGNPASLVLCDALGNELDRADQNSLSATQHADGGTYEALMETMRGEAVRVARGAEDAIASVLGGLDLDGDGIPDVPAPIELENAPEGAEAEIYDNVEDSVDEMANLDSQMIDTAIEEDGQFADTVEAISETDLPIAAPEAPEASFEDTVEHVTETVAEYEAPSLPDPDLETLTSLDVESADLPETSLDPETEAYDNSFADAPFDETPDVGEAVANLANQVNNTPQMPETPPTPDVEAPAPEPEIERPAAAPRPSKAAGLITGGIGFNSLSSSLRGGGTLEQTTNKLAVEEKDVEPPAGNTPSPQDQVAAPSVASPSEVSMAVPKPGQILSLSGLTDNIDLRAPEPSEAATVPPAPEPVEPVREEPVAQEPVQEPVAQTPAAAPAIETPAQPPAEAPAPPAEETPQEAEAQKEQQQPPKRFNPWI